MNLDKVCAECLNCDPVEIYELHTSRDGLVWQGCKHSLSKRGAKANHQAWNRIREQDMEIDSLKAELAEARQAMKTWEMGALSDKEIIDRQKLELDEICKLQPESYANESAVSRVERLVDNLHHFQEANSLLDQQSLKYQKFYMEWKAKAEKLAEALKRIAEYKFNDPGQVAKAALEEFISSTQGENYLRF